MASGNRAGPDDRESGMRTVVNDYGAVLEPWKARLIVDRARRMGVPRDELEDVQQELVWDVAAVRFDPAKAGSESTPLVARIDNRVASYLRRNTRYLARVMRLRPTESCEEKVALRIDVRQAVAALPLPERTVCLGLSQGHTAADIARHVGVGRSTVVRLMTKIRRHFRECGLEGWLCD